MQHASGIEESGVITANRRSPLTKTSTLSRKLKELDSFLLSEAVGEEAMLLAEMDGYLAGVAVCPDLILPSEWLPLIWGGDEGPEFEDQQQAQAVLDLITHHYNDILRQLNRGAFQPIYDFDIDDSVLWETWIEGFWTAMGLRRESWLAYAEAKDEAVQEAFFILWRLVELASCLGDCEPIEKDEEMEGAAADLIPYAVQTLHEARALSNPADAARRASVHVGRNDPCPCGSGKKFKKCCLS